MKRKIVCILILTTLLLSGCAQQNNQGQGNSAAPESAAVESAAPSTSADTAHPSAQTQSGSVQNSDAETEMISEEEAKRIALSHAGLTDDQVIFIKSGIDRDDGKRNYDIEFYTQDQNEYDYEIDPYTGEILDYDYDAEYYMSPTATSESENITVDDAKQIALDQVPGATLRDIREFESDYDDGRLQYEGKIYYEQNEYEFVIDGSSGAILEWDIEPIYGGVS